MTSYCLCEIWLFNWVSWLSWNSCVPGQMANVCIRTLAVVACACVFIMSWNFIHSFVWSLFLLLNFTVRTESWDKTKIVNSESYQTRPPTTQWRQGLMGPANSHVGHVRLFTIMVNPAVLAHSCPFLWLCMWLHMMCMWLLKVSETDVTSGLALPSHSTRPGAQGVLIFSYRTFACACGKFDGCN